VTAPTFRQARRLRPGDEVAVVATSSPLEEGDSDLAEEFVRSLGLVPTLFPSVFESGPAAFLAGADALRARDLEQAYADDRFAAVWSARGGYGAARMLDLVDWPRLRTATPKAVLGYSDVTAVHEAFASKLGLATLHAPMPASKRLRTDPIGVAHLRATLFDPDGDAATDLVGGAPTAAVVGGRARGWLTGGNVSQLAAAIGTATALPDHTGALVFLEDVTEEPYRIDGYLTAMLRSGWFDGVVGVVLGDFTDCGTAEDRSATEPVATVLAERLSGLGVPVVGGLRVGHGDVNRTLPLGVRADLDADAGVLRLRQPGLL